MAEQPKDDEEKKESLYSKRFVQRREIRSLSDDEHKRFFNALETMMQNKVDDDNKEIPGSSPWFRCASYHGIPTDFCHHSRETFPGWHRVYLWDFEQELQNADIKNGNDGNIFLPYWDWTTNPEQPFAKEILKWPNDPAIKGWPKNLFPTDFWSNKAFDENNFDRNGNNFWTRNKITNIKDWQSRLVRQPDNEISKTIINWKIPKEAAKCLLGNQHYVHASGYQDKLLGGMRYPSIEKPHGWIHVAVGGYVGIVEMASYDIAFWLHHCNVDRQYESYLSYEIVKTDEYHPKIEFENYQKQRERRGRRNNFKEPLTPFKKPNSDEDFMPSDTFKMVDYGYNYDKLPTKLPLSDINQMLQVAPTYVTFKNVVLGDFGGRCFSIHVFIYDKNKVNTIDDEKENKINTIDDIDYKSDNYGGTLAFFSRSSESCSNCAESEPVDMSIDITQTITKLGISRYDIFTRIYLQQTADINNKTLSSINDKDIPLPQPIINGPLFENKTDSFTKNDSDKQNKNEVKSAQSFLSRYGYYDGIIDGIYGDITHAAVKEYQQAIGLESNGILCIKTRDTMENVKRCSNIDPYATNKVEDVKSDFNKAKYKNKKEISYKIGNFPGYLNRKRISECIQSVCKQYSDAMDGALTFKEIEGGDDNDNEEKEIEVDIKFEFITFSGGDDDKLRDGPGGILGYGGIGFVQFDLSEYWVIGDNENDEKQLSKIDDINTWKNGQPVLSLYYTALHELGHSLGLKHSIKANNVMSPWYNPKQIILTDDDKKQLKTVVKL